MSQSLVGVHALLFSSALSFFRGLGQFLSIFLFYRYQTLHQAGGDEMSLRSWFRVFDSSCGTFANVQHSHLDVKTAPHVRSAPRFKLSTSPSLVSNRIAPAH